MKRTNHSARPTTRAISAIGLAALAFVAVACNKAKPDTTPVPQLMPRVAITSVKGDTASELMAAIYARVLENSGVRVTRVDSVSLDRAGYYQALQDGEFQMIPEYSGDLLHFVLDGTDTGTTPSTTETLEPATTQAPALMPTTTTIAPTTVPGTDTAATDAQSTTTEATTTTVAATTTTSGGSTTTTTIAPTNARDMVAQVVALNSLLPNTLLAYSSTLAQHRTVIACTTAAIKSVSQYQLFSYTNLASLAPQLRLGAPASWQADDESGLPALERYYAPEFKSVDTVEEADIAAAVDAGTVDCVTLDSFNPLIATKSLRVLFDDRYMIPSNGLIVLMASTVNTPEVTAALDKVTVVLTTERLNQMLNEITSNGTAVSVVANAFADNL